MFVFQGIMYEAFVPAGSNHMNAMEEDFVRVAKESARTQSLMRFLLQLPPLSFKGAHRPATQQQEDYAKHRLFDERFCFHRQSIVPFRGASQLHLDPALEPSKMTGDETFVFGLHPHGVLGDYRILLDGATREAFPKVCRGAGGGGGRRGRDGGAREGSSEFHYCPLPSLLLCLSVSFSLSLSLSLSLSFCLSRVFFIFVFLPLSFVFCVSGSVHLSLPPRSLSLDVSKSGA